MKPKPLESDLRKKVKAYADELGLLAVKHTSMYSKGHPDWEIYLPGGRPLLLELKRRGGRPTVLQMKRIALLRKLGYWVECVDNFEDAKAKIEAYFGADFAEKER